MINFLRRKKQEIALGKNNRKRAFLNYKDVKNILIIFHTSDLDEIIQIAELLQKDGKNVFAWTVRSKDKASRVNYPSFVRAIDPSKERTWSQNLSKQVISEFEELNYDTFLDMTVSDNVILDYLLAINSSLFCIGIRERQVKVYDFIMLKKDENTLLSVYEQLKYFLTNIME